MDTAGVLAMDRAYMRDTLGTDGPGFMTVQVKGHSMEPTIIDGETIVIDTRVTEFDGSSIYVVRVGKHLLVKRLTLSMAGGIWVRSDNPNHGLDDREFGTAEAESIHFVGRMVWPKYR